MGLKHVAEDTAESPVPLSTETTADMNTNPDGPVPKTPGTHGQAGTQAPAPPEAHTCPLQAEHLLVAPGPREADSEVPVGLTPELPPTTLGTGHEDVREEASVDPCAWTSSSQACGEHPPEARHPRDQLEIEGESQSQGQGGHGGRPELQGQGVEEEREGMAGEVCPSGLLGAQPGEVLCGREGKQRQQKMLENGRLVEAGERERPEEGDWEVPGYSGIQEGGQNGLQDRRTLQQDGEKTDVRGPEKDWEDEWSEKGAGEQTQRSAEGQEAEAGWREEGPGAGEPLQEVGGDEGSEDGEQDGPSPRALVAPELSLLGEEACLPTAKSQGAQQEPRAAELSPRPQSLAQRSAGGSPEHIPSGGLSPAGHSAKQDRAQDGRLMGCELEQGPVSSPGDRDVSATLSERPPQIGAAPGLEDISPTSPPLAASRREPSLDTPHPETSTALLSPVSPSPAGDPETPPVLPRGPSSSTVHPLDPGTGPYWTRPRSPLANGSDALHPRSNSFPGSQRPTMPPDLGRSAFSSSHSELPQMPPRSASYGRGTPEMDGERSPRVIPEPTPGQHAQDCTPNPDSQPRGAPHHPASAPGAPACVSVDGSTLGPPPGRATEGRPPHPGGLPTRSPQPALLTLGPPKVPLPPVPDAHVSRQLRPLPSTPVSVSHHHHAQRYNKPLPPTPTPDPTQPHPAGNPRTYKPLPPLPTADLSSEPPPLPPKMRGRSKSTQGVPAHTGAQGAARPAQHEWPVPTAPAAVTVAAGRTSWPPATSRPADALTASARTRSKGAPGLAFSNMTNVLRPSSSTTTTAGTPGQPVPRPGLGPFTLSKPVIQEDANGLRTSQDGSARRLGRAGHPHLEKASSWPHRREPGRAAEDSAGQATAPAEGTSKHKGWNRQGLRRPSILPEGTADTRGLAMEKFPGSSDAIVYREKKPKDVKGGFARRCSKLINSSQLLYQEYSDVVLNKQIQSQQRLDSIAEEPGPDSPRQPQRPLASPELSVQRLSMVSSASLWQEIPVVRNSTVLLSMTHEDQKLQEAKFELIVSEASYLRSLHIAVDHFQLSALLRATLSNQDHQWLFSRLQDVRDVSTTFLSDLEENFENNIFTFQVCDVVLNHAPNFRRVYLPYVTNQTYQERTFQNLLNSNSSFREVLEKLESDPVCQRLSLKSFLILPFQRITRLKLLLQNILKRTQPGSSEEAEATKAHHALEELIRDCNENVRKMRRTEELIYLSQKIEFECKIFPLISQSRWLVKSGELTALEFSVNPGMRRKLNTRPVYLHLFNDCLLLSRPREGGRFLVFDHASFSSYRGEKCEMKLHGQHKNLFRLFLRHNTQGAQAEFLFSTETQSEKLRWISALAIPREDLDLLECYDSPQVQCLRAYKPRENDELALEKADVVMVTQQSSDGWLEGMRLSDGERGWFPVQQVEFISNPEVWVRNLKEAQRVKMAKLQLVEQKT
ncbi:rho guanine nucleotide exchange factor 5 [Sorex fumeus]|uniref:rho guanine nucleotide exchange factor 5 n=1 Tax=Sorex fumeus TaxID=62283 RepID=UPI0024AD4A44|nr:rho guanine nucleotide exchange factor 5 [Sorex fumeus]